MTSGPAVPGHVPDERVWDHDFAGFLRELDDPYLAGARLHDGPDIVWATSASYGVPSWIFTRHNLVEEAFADAAKFSSARGPIIAAVLDTGWMMLPVEADPPLHQQYRTLMHPFFTPAAITRRSTQIYGLCDTLIDAFLETGRCEFIGDFASILPNAIVISLLGMPQDMLGQFLDWEHDSVHRANNDIRRQGGVAIHEYLRSFIGEKRRSGIPASDLMQSLLDGQLKTRRLSEEELLGIVYNLFVAGLDTVFATFGWVMRHLASDQPLQTRLRNSQGDIPAAVNEFTRAFGVSAPTRVVAQDMIFHGVPMKKGDGVMLSTLLAGRDPQAFGNPHSIDTDRKARHATFGAGAHVCLGIHLAKREIAIMLERFLARTRNIHLLESNQFQYHTSGTIGVDRLELGWDRP